MTIYKVTRRGKSRIKAVELAPGRHIIENVGAVVPIVVRKDDYVRVDLAEIGGHAFKFRLHYPNLSADEAQHLHEIEVQPPMGAVIFSINATNRDNTKDHMSIERHHQGWIK